MVVVVVVVVVVVEAAQNVLSDFLFKLFYPRYPRLCRSVRLSVHAVFYAEKLQEEHQPYAAGGAVDGGREAVQETEKVVLVVIAAVVFLPTLRLFVSALARVCLFGDAKNY
ncbi:hypothetical protein E2C01_051957 [Portunus trituberculatus]|uniref:Uncharacterized protein n=1 Tax=Portunus trituberculatus TaxID=210409 RepID=A0A5B7GKP3_PORTR|nr:hypothetical protein [Portunus trituberculatus]